MYKRQTNISTVVLVFYWLFNIVVFNTVPGRQKMPPKHIQPTAAVEHAGPPETAACRRPTAECFFFWCGSPMLDALSALRYAIRANAHCCPLLVEKLMNYNSN